MQNVYQSNYQTAALHQHGVVTIDQMTATQWPTLAGRMGKQDPVVDCFSRPSAYEITCNLLCKQSCGGGTANTPITQANPRGDVHCTELGPNKGIGDCIAQLSAQANIRDNYSQASAPPRGDNEPSCVRELSLRPTHLERTSDDQHHYQ